MTEEVRLTKSEYDSIAQRVLGQSALNREPVTHIHGIPIIIVEEVENPILTNKIPVKTEIGIEGSSVTMKIKEEKSNGEERQARQAVQIET